WNCWCPTCRAARADARRAHPRTQSSAAVSVDGQRWFLLNASPDVREQLGRLPSGDPPGVRFVPVEGVVVTDGELDHTLGIALLREARHLQLYATDAVHTVLERDSKILPVTRAFAEVDVRPLPLGATSELRYRDGTETELTVQAFAVAGDAPRFASQELDGHTIGLLLRDRLTGGVCAFVPGCGDLDGGLLELLGKADLVLFDGTFWTNDELLDLGIGDRRAREMGHLPISGPGGSLERLQTLARPRRVYTHINNSNPVLLEDSPERASVTAAGLLVGDDGMAFTV
ncbi:MAG: pyrroloquinoline quinone biosynthesis protein PqqB, partial [Gemmatimonadales bacterium]